MGTDSSHMPTYGGMEIEYCFLQGFVQWMNFHMFASLHTFIQRNILGNFFAFFFTDLSH